MHAWRRGFACKGTTGGIFGTFAGLFVGGLRFFSGKLASKKRHGFVREERNCRIFFDSKKGVVFSTGTRIIYELGSLVDNRMIRREVFFVD